MQAGSAVTRSLEDDLEDLDETDLAIDRLGRRIQAQEHRIAQLKKDGLYGPSAEQIVVSMRDSLKELIRHRMLITQAIAYRR